MCWVAGITMHRTWSATFLPLRIWAATAMSSSRPLVQEPMTTWSILIWPTSEMGWAFSGRWGKATVGSMVLRSISTVRTYSASGSAS